MDNNAKSHNKKRLLQKPLVSNSKQTCFNEYRSSNALAVMGSIETLHHKKIIAAGTVGFRFEVDLFK